MRYLIPKTMGLAILGLGPALWHVHCAPTGLNVFHQESTSDNTFLTIRAPTPQIRPPPPGGRGGTGAAGGAAEEGGAEAGQAGGSRSGTLNPGGAGEGASGGSGVLIPGQGGNGGARPGFVPQNLPNAKARGYNFEEVDFSEPGTITLPGDPKVGTLYKVTNPAYEEGEYAINEIGVDSNAKSVSICDANNLDEAGLNADAMTMSEITMNVWVDKSGGQQPTALQTIYLKNVVEDTTSPVIREGHELYGRQTYTVRANEIDAKAQEIFFKLTNGGKGVGTIFGGAVNRMNTNWIGKSVTSFDVEGMSVTYHLG